MPNLDELLAEEAARYDVRVPPVAQIHRRRRRRATTAAAGGLTALVLIAGALGAVLRADGPTDDSVAQEPSPGASASPAAGPSQTPRDAERDGVLPAVAELAFADRVDVIAREEAPEGVWAISRMP